jgi:hypothetical protein
VADKGIGVNRALRTQVGTLAAATGPSGVGIINIANGGAAPVTLNIALLQAGNAGGGTITLTNNGTINDTTAGIVATGAINITANGATADLNTGSGAGITSYTGSVNLTVGRDINWGDGVGVGSITAATGITASAGGNITLNANASVVTLLGNISLTAGGNFTMLTSPGSLANAPQITNGGAPGGTISLSAGPGHTMTVDSTNATTAIQSNNGAIFLAADAMVINKGVNAGSGRVDLLPASLSGETIVLGGSSAPGVLGITQAELNEITAGVTQIGANVMSNIIIAAPISNPINSNVLTLINNGTISEGAFGSLNAANLRIGSTGPVTLNNPNNDIAVLAANTTNGLTVNDGTNNLTVGTVDGDTGIVTTNSATSLTAAT